MNVKRHKIHSIRFRQWSRKSYALFKSVGRHVTIGRIKNVIADRLLNKQNNLFSLSTFISDIKRKKENDEIFKDEGIQNQNLILPFQYGSSFTDIALIEKTILLSS